MTSNERPLSTSEIPENQIDLACTPDFCAASDPLSPELGVNQEVQLDAFDDAAREWSQTLEEARESAVLLYGYFEQHERDNRHRLRPGERYPGGTQVYALYDVDEKGSKVDFIASVRRGTINGIRERATTITGDASLESVLLHGESGQLEALSMQLEEEMTAAMRNAQLKNPASRFLTLGATKSEIENPYLVLFYKELLARTQLALTVRVAPEALADMIDAKRVTNLPDYMQQLLAVDINADKHSIILEFAKRQKRASETFFDYLHENNLTAGAREATRVMTVVAKALGSCACPMNSFELCREVADAIPLEELPKDISDDMLKKQQGATEQSIAQLRALGQAKRVSSWWNFSATILPRSGQATARRKRQGAPPAVGTAASFDRSLDKSLQHETLPPTTVQVSWKGIDQIREAQIGDETAIAAIVEEALEEKMFQDYIKLHREQVALPDFIRNALTHILVAPTYRQRQAPVRQCSTEEPRRSRVDGQLLKIWRLSGANFPGGGKVGRDTRIYFGHEGKEGLRRVEIIKISHKADTVNRFNASRSVL